MVEFADVHKIAGGNDWPEDLVSLVKRSADDLALTFNREGWTWSGEPVTYSAIHTKVWMLIFYVAQQMSKTGQHSCQISSGRLMVEGALVDTDGSTAGFTVSLHYSVGHHR